ncbi:hypothetical protein TWF594_009410 [Orbilia oligospora]|uniref:Spindle pole body-associated protein cut12 domain-containing protein n=1 Tax=Orbilia oligospora TaxID=2813651 RepID=A0A7C8JVJ0_ORBOL|nr:hypothetical protein TWF703_009569 [Orbilia oligospora]KAF3132895.1 hypothetical protein TWF594_009410 [Orbilia oligospora]
MPQNKNSGGRYFGNFVTSEDAQNTHKTGEGLEGGISKEAEDANNTRNHGRPRTGTGVKIQVDLHALFEAALPDLMASPRQPSSSSRVQLLQPKQQQPPAPPRPVKPQQPLTPQQRPPPVSLQADPKPKQSLRKTPSLTPSLLAIPHPSHSITLSLLPPDNQSPSSSSSSSSSRPISPSLSTTTSSESVEYIHQQHPEAQNVIRKRDAFLNMLAWLRGDQQGEEEEVDQDLIIPDQDLPDDPETPGPATFAFNAFRNGLFGTPKPDLEVQDIRPHHNQRRERDHRPKFGRDVMSDEDVFTSSKRRLPLESRSPGRFKTFEDAMTPPRRNPQSILVTPGNTISKKKTVSFGPDQVHEDTFCYEARTGRVRSGLPADYPGKFPSPWTPKITNELPKRRTSRELARVEEIEIFEDQNKPYKGTPKPKTKASTVSKTKDDAKSVDDQIQALRENTARINDMIEEASVQQATDADITVNLDEPRSRSGVYWKDRYSNDINQAEKKVEFYKARKDTSVEFASKKDEQAANLATRLKEEIELRKKMQAEIDKWQKMAMETRTEPNPTVNAPLTETYQQKTIERLRRETSEYRELIRQKEVEMTDHEYQLDRQRSEIDRQARRIKDLEASLQAKKEAADEASLFNANAESEVRNLKRELRKAEAAAAGKDVLTAKFENSQREVERLKQQLSLVKEENHRLKVQQKSDNPLDDIPVNSVKASTPASQPDPEQDIWQSLSSLNAPKDKPRSRGSPKITEHSAFPNVSVVDRKHELGGIFSKPTPAPVTKPKDTIPTIDEYLKQEDSNLTPKKSTAVANLRSATTKNDPNYKSTPKPRRSVISTPIMTEKEILRQLDHSDLSLPPISPTMASMSDTDLDKLRSIAKPLPRRSREDLKYDPAAPKPVSPMKTRGVDDAPPSSPMPEIGVLPPKYETDDEKAIMRRQATSPMPKYFNFEKSPNPRRGSFASLRSFANTKLSKKSPLELCDGISLKTTAAVAAPVEVTGVGVTAKTSAGSDADAKRKLAAAKMAEMKARMKAESKAAKN